MTITLSTVEKLLEYLGAGDSVGAMGLFADSIDWFVPGSARMPWTGRLTHRYEVASYLRIKWSHFKPGHSQVRVIKTIVDGEDAVAVGAFSHELLSNGRRMEAPFAMHVVVTNGEITRMHLFTDTLALAMAFAYPD